MITFHEWLEIREAEEFGSPKYVMQYILAAFSWPTVLTIAKALGDAGVGAISAIASTLAVPEMPYEPLKQLGKLLLQFVQNLSKLVTVPHQVAAHDVEPFLDVLRQHLQEFRGVTVQNLLDVFHKVTVNKGQVWDAKAEAAYRQRLEQAAATLSQVQPPRT